MLFLGLKPISSLVLTPRNAIKLICILYDGQDKTKVIIQYNILLLQRTLVPVLSDNTWPSLGRAVASLLDDIHQVESVESTVSFKKKRKGDVTV